LGEMMREIKSSHLVAYARAEIEAHVELEANRLLKQKARIISIQISKTSHHSVDRASTYRGSVWYEIEDQSDAS
jgi:hypothetical protein